jgi:hypothetical protein
MLCACSVLVLVDQLKSSGFNFDGENDFNAS